MVKLTKPDTCGLFEDCLDCGYSPDKCVYDEENPDSIIKKIQIKRRSAEGWSIAELSKKFDVTALYVTEALKELPA